MWCAVVGSDYYLFKERIPAFTPSPEITDFWLPVRCNLTTGRESDDSSTHHCRWQAGYLTPIRTIK